MKIYNKDKYTIVKNKDVCNRYTISIVIGYSNNNGLPVYDDVISKIILSHFGNIKVKNEEVELAIEMAKIYIDKLLEKENNID